MDRKKKYNSVESRSFIFKFNLLYQWHYALKSFPNGTVGKDKSHPIEEYINRYGRVFVSLSVSMDPILLSSLFHNFLIRTSLNGEMVWTKTMTIFTSSQVAQLVDQKPRDSATDGRLLFVHLFLGFYSFVLCLSDSLVQVLHGPNIWSYRSQLRVEIQQKIITEPVISLFRWLAQ